MFFLATRNNFETKIAILIFDPPKLRVLTLIGQIRHSVSRLKLKLVGFKALIETGGVRSIEIFMSRTRLIGVGLVSPLND